MWNWFHLSKIANFRFYSISTSILSVRFHFQKSQFRFVLALNNQKFHFHLSISPSINTDAVGSYGSASDSDHFDFGCLRDEESFRLFQKTVTQKLHTIGRYLFSIFAKDEVGTLFPLKYCSELELIKYFQSFALKFTLKSNISANFSSNRSCGRKPFWKFCLCSNYTPVLSVFKAWAF
jgi:hypothetical protein